MDRHDESAARLRERIEQRLEQLLPPDTTAPQNLHRAMRYSVLAPGKRLRGTVAVLAVQTHPGMDMQGLDFACAIEMAHAASLVIDDLPMMDDASMRRGQPATHRVFGEDTATLAAFSLLNRAYGVLAEDQSLSPALRVDLVRLLHDAVGTAGLTGGQELDLHRDYLTGSVDAVSDMYHRKTGVLFIAAAEGGARIAGLSGAQLQAVQNFARQVGLAYQLADDLADSLKPGGAGEASVIPLLGRRRSERLLARLLTGAARSIDSLGEAGTPLAAFVRRVFNTASLNTPRATRIASA
jgi:geranylgeranyl diphosphate synthase type II